MRILLVATLCSALLGAGGAAAQAQDAQGQLWDAAISGDTAAIRRALSAGAKIDSLDVRRSPNGRYALHWAAFSDHPAAVRILLAAGAPIEGENRTGFSALNHAAEAGALEAARVLLAAGADPGHANKEGVVPAETARVRGFDAVANLIEAAERGERPKME
jgi:ankyrin repeat protein